MGTDSVELEWFVIGAPSYAVLSSANRQAINRWLNDVLGWPDTGLVIDSIRVREDGNKVKLVCFHRSRDEGLLELADFRRGLTSRYVVTATDRKMFPLEVFFDSVGVCMFRKFSDADG